MNMLRRSRSALVVAAAMAAVTVTSVAAQPRAATRSFMWKATRQQGAVYLVGSVHMLTKDFYPLAPALEAGFKDSDLLVEEVDLAEMLAPEKQFSLLSRGMLPAGQTLDKVVSPSTMALVNARVGGLGMPASALQQFKPWFLAMTLMAVEWEKAGFDATLGLDKHFYDRAKAAGKSVIGLETAESQIDRLDSMSADLQEQLLRSSLSEADTTRNSLKTIVSAWRRGDSASLEKTLLSDFTQYPAAYRSLIVERNNNWVPQIDACLAKSQPCLVVVGAAHLVGPDGLLTLLQRKGYKIEQQ